MNQGQKKLKPVPPAGAIQHHIPHLFYFFINAYRQSVRGIAAWNSVVSLGSV